MWKFAQFLDQNPKKAEHQYTRNSLDCEQRASQNNSGSLKLREPGQVLKSKPTNSIKKWELVYLTSRPIEQNQPYRNSLTSLEKLKNLHKMNKKINIAENLKTFALINKLRNYLQALQKGLLTTKDKQIGEKWKMQFLLKVAKFVVIVAWKHFSLSSKTLQ